ncbi:increased level of polyploidy1-1D [Planoprotostelium fungivorum]|uniref:Increased level of polyploidy1-1D n=1 Tax=Planoprotostelium fungivorum TaxID=1890364 RepID=A0A2P6N3Q8_9EUKA|nr:increased level of polyploidy1-1D [Planoprotostelium fungivorum]
MMFRKGARRNVMHRKTRSNIEEEEDQGQTQIGSKPAPTAKIIMPPQKKILSFLDTEEGNDLIAEPIAGKKKIKGFSHLSQTEVSTESIASYSASYDADSIRKLKQNSLSFITDVEDPELIEAQSGSGFHDGIAEQLSSEAQLNQEEEPVVVENVTILNAEEAEKMEEEEEEVDEDIQRWRLSMIRKGGGKLDKRSAEILNGVNQKERKPKTKRPRTVDSDLTKVKYQDVEAKVGKLFGQELQKAQGEREDKMKELDLEMADCRSTLERMDKDKDKVEKERDFFRSMKQFINDYCECMEEKAPEIEEYEKQLLNIRGKYKRVKSEKLTPEQLWHQTDDAEPNYEIRDLMDRADQLFEDVDEEFHSIERIKQRFQLWKHLYPSSYRDAYVSLSLPSLLAPLVRLQCIKWDPLKEQFEDLDWFTQLLDYGAQDNTIDPEDEDNNLIPTLVMNIVAPNISNYISALYNPISQSETKSVIGMIQHIADFLQPDSNVITELLKSISGTIQGAMTRETNGGPPSPLLEIQSKICGAFKEQIIAEELMLDSIMDIIIPYSSQGTALEHLSLFEQLSKDFIQGQTSNKKYIDEIGRHAEALYSQLEAQENNLSILRLANLLSTLGEKAKAQTQFYQWKNNGVPILKWFSQANKKDQVGIKLSRDSCPILKIVMCLWTLFQEIIKMGTTLFQVPFMHP